MSGPILDVVIPVHDRLDWLAPCLTALAAFTENPFRLILVDNDSGPETRRFMAALEKGGFSVQSKLKGVTVLHRTNDCFSAGVNAGVELGDAPYVAILNSDVLVTPGWDVTMISEAAGSAVGLVGASTNAASGLQGNPALARIMKPNFLIFCAVVTRREVWDRVGPLDDVTFHDWCGGEDLDWSWRAVEAGLQLLVSEAYVHHGCSQTYRLSSTVEEQGAAHARAHERLIAKWGVERFLKGIKCSIHVAIGIPSGDYTCSTGFAKDLLSLKKVPGITFEVIWIERHVVHLARETLADLVCARDPMAPRHFDYLLMIDDDMRFPPDMLTRLVAADKDVVGVVAYQRRAPHTTCVYEWSDELAGHVAMEGIEHTGLRKVAAVGFGAVLIKTEALRRLRKPRFEFGGQKKLGEDLDFCAKARDAGVEVWCETDVVLGHVGDPVVVDEAYKAQYRRQIQGL